MSLETEQLARVPEIATGFNRKRKLSESSHVNTGSEAKQPVLEEMPIKKLAPFVSLGEQNGSRQKSRQAGYTIHELVKKVNKLKKKGLYAEYEKIRSEPPAGTFECSRMKSNEARNRYCDVLCYDHSRIHLPASDSNKSGYINANYVDGYQQQKEYICTQGPLPVTSADFWRMIWENKVHVIAMTTRTVERSRVKCDVYWPQEQGSIKRFEGFTVSNEGTTTNQNFTETQMLLSDTISGKSRSIYHIQFTTWPDHGVPQVTPFLDFLFRVRQLQESATRALKSSEASPSINPPIAVHCSAGIGRTGTFLTVDVCLRQLSDQCTVNVQETVRKIRCQRALSVQMPDQYLFCYQAVIGYAQKSGLVSDQVVSLDTAGR